MKFPKKIALAAGVVSAVALLASGTVMAAGLSACPTDESTLNYIFSQISTNTYKDCSATNPSGYGTLLASGGYLGVVLVDADNNAITLPSDGSGQACLVLLEGTPDSPRSFLLYGAKSGKFMIQNLKSNIENLQLTQSDVYAGPNFEGGALNNGFEERLCTYKLGNTPYVYQLLYIPGDPYTGLYQPAYAGSKKGVIPLTASKITMFNHNNQLDGNGNIQSTTVNINYKDSRHAVCPDGYLASNVKALINYKATPSSTDVSKAVSDLMHGKLSFCHPDGLDWSVDGSGNNQNMHMYCDSGTVTSDTVKGVIYAWNCAKTVDFGSSKTKSSRFLNR